VAAGEAVAPANDLTGTDLGNRVLKAGAYRFTSSAQLTGPLTLDAEGDPAAQFVFEIASSLTTASARLRRAAQRRQPLQRLLAGRELRDPRHHHGLQGNLMALASISLNNGASVIGACSRATARSA